MSRHVSPSARSTSTDVLTNDEDAAFLLRATIGIELAIGARPYAIAIQVSIPLLIVASTLTFARIPERAFEQQPHIPDLPDDAR
jgi:hypothetical protein